MSFGGFGLNDNQLTGTIPSQLGGLSNLERWRLRNNGFTDCVPAGLAEVEDSDFDSLRLEVCRVGNGTRPGGGDAVGGRREPDPGGSFTLSATVTNADEEGTLLLSSVQPEVDTPLTATLDDPGGSISDVAWLWEISPDRTTWDAISGVTSNS